MSSATSLSAQGNAVFTQLPVRVSSWEREAGPPAPQSMPMVRDPLAPPSVEVRCAALTANARSKSNDAVLPKVRNGRLGLGVVMSSATSLSAQGNAVFTQLPVRVSSWEREAGPPAPQSMPMVRDPLAHPSVGVRCAALTATARSKSNYAV